MPPCAQPTELSLAPRSPLLQPSFLSSPCLSYRVQSPGGSLSHTFDSSLAAAELRGAAGAYARGPGARYKARIARSLRNAPLPLPLSLELGIIPPTSFPAAGTC